MRISLGLLVAGCSGTKQAPRPTVALPAIARSAESREDIAALLTDMAAVEMCDQVRGRFLPIADVPAEGGERGDEPIGGRWWVRRCIAHVDGGHVSLSLEGFGWAWGQGGAWGFNLHDYIFFGGGGRVIGDVDASYDQSRRLAWMQFRPLGEPVVGSTITSTVETHANFWGSLLDVVSIGIAGDSADSRAREIVDSKVREAFQRRLGAGFVVLFDLAHRQRDGFVTASASPLRPFGSDRRWLVNERQILRAKPGGYHLNGPFAPTLAAGVDFVVHRGSVRYRAECEADVTAWFEPATRGVRPSLAPPTHTQRGTVAVGPLATKSVGAACPWYLITEAAAEDALVDVRVHADETGYPATGP